MLTTKNGSRKRFVTVDPKKRSKKRSKTAFGKKQLAEKKANFVDYCYVARNIVIALKWFSIKESIKLIEKEAKSHKVPSPVITIR